MTDLDSKVHNEDFVLKKEKFTLYVQQSHTITQTLIFETTKKLPSNNLYFSLIHDQQFLLFNKKSGAILGNVQDQILSGQKNNLLHKINSYLNTDSINEQLETWSIYKFDTVNLSVTNAKRK